MSKERKLLKIVCFIFVLVAVLSVVLGGVTLAGMGELDPDDTALAAVYGALGIASGVLWVVCAGAGIRGANTPRKVGPVRTLSVVAVLVSLAGIAVGVLLDGVGLGELAYVAALVLAVMGFSLAGKVAEQAQL